MHEINSVIHVRDLVRIRLLLKKGKPFLMNPKSSVVNECLMWFLEGLGVTWPGGEPLHSDNRYYEGQNTVFHYNNGGLDYDNINFYTDHHKYGKYNLVTIQDHS